MATVPRLTKAHTCSAQWALLPPRWSPSWELSNPTLRRLGDPRRALRRARRLALKSKALCGPEQVPCDGIIAVRSQVLHYTRSTKCLEQGEAALLRAPALDDGVK